MPEVSAAHEVAAFVEKPPARPELRAAGALWNTMVMCGTVDALWDLGRKAEPQLLDILDSLAAKIGRIQGQQPIYAVAKGPCTDSQGTGSGRFSTTRSSFARSIGFTRCSANPASADFCLSDS